MKLSKFGEKFTRESGTRQLMDDFGELAAHGDQIYMLGGGNPSHIPQVEQLFRQRMQELLADPAAFANFIGDYDPPQGNLAFLDALVGLLRNEYGWNINAKNIAVTNGSQASFFMLFNLLAGEFSDGSRKEIMLPLTPEYIGYSDVGLSDGLFTSQRPTIEHLDDRLFKYHVDFGALEITDDIAAICVSRPTNPTGNVLTDEEVSGLAALAKVHSVPLIIDNAYGTPFPYIVFTEATPIWDEHIVLCMSLSKLGLPATRTGIVVANEEIIDAVTNMNAIFNLAPGSFGATLAEKLVASGRIMDVGRELIMPFYRDKAWLAVTWLHEALAGFEYFIHKPEGAIFLWVWFPGLPVTSRELYVRLRARQVFVLAGEYFFPGLGKPWPHQYECIRISYAQDAAIVSAGIRIIGEEVRRIFAENST